MSDSVSIGQVSKLKQGDLLRVCRERGWTQAEMGRRLGISPTDIGKLCNMQCVPKLSDEAARLIVEWTGKLPEDLVPEWLSLGLDAIDGRRSVRFAEIGQQQLEAAVNRMSLPPHPSDVIDRESIRSALSSAAKCLTPRERVVIEKRFGFGDGVDMSLDDVGAHLAITRERVRQIETKAIRKMAAQMGRLGGLGLAKDGKLNKLLLEQKLGEERRKARLAALRHIAARIP